MVNELLGKFPKKVMKKVMKSSRFLEDLDKFIALKK